MRTLRPTRPFLFPILAATMFASCSVDSPTTPRDDSPLVRTVPAAGETNYDPGAPIFMRFNEPVDSLHIRDWFFCVDSAAHDALRDSLSRGTMGGWMMGNVHGDTLEFCRRLRSRSVAGSFHWNPIGDSCTFVPFEPLVANQDYVLMYRSDMRNHQGQRMHHMGESMDQDLMLRFHTQ